MKAHAALNLGERLRVVGQWLDSLAAQGAEITSVDESICVCCTDASGAEQRLALNLEELRGYSEQGSQRRANPFGATHGRWGPRLRTLGQRLELQGLYPTRIWSHEDHLYARVQYEQQSVELDYTLLELDERDRVERNQRLVQGLRRRKSDRWWACLRIVGASREAAVG